MANLSNINNILRVSSSGVGLNKNNTGPSELDIESAGADMIDMTRTGLKTYRFAISGSSDFSIFDVNANNDRLIISSGGDAYFPESLRVGIGTTSIYPQGADAILKIYSASGGSRLYLQSANTGTAVTDGSQIYIGTSNLNISNMEGETRFFNEGSIMMDISKFDGSANANPLTSSNIRIWTHSKTGWLPGDILSKIEFYSNDVSGIGARNAASIRVVNETGDGSTTTTFSGGLAFYTSAYNSTEEEAMRIDSSGNVGIGTTSPGRKLTITGDASGDANNLLLANENDTDGDSASIGFSMLSNNTYVKSGIFFKRTTTQGRGDLIFANNNEVNGNNVTLSDAKITIQPAGNVGIGTTSPVLKLDVQGTTSRPTPFGSAAVNGVFRVGSGGTNPILDIGSSSSAPYEIWLQAHVPSNTYGTPISLQPLGGNVGIGTTSPGARLDVVMPNSGGAARQDIFRLLQSGQNTLSCYMYGGTTDLVQLHVSGAEQHLSLTTGAVATATTDTGIHLRSGGNVGIGTISPTKKLTVNAGTASGDGINITGSSSPAIYINETSGTVNSSFQNDGAGSYLGTSTSHPMIFRTANTERMRITSGGDIQIPTNSAKIQLISSGSGSYTSINRDASNNLVVRNTANNSIFSLENGGNLVIGGTLTQGSDISYKENIKPLESQLDIVNKLNPVSYNRIGQKENEIGFIAQEVEKLIPDLVSENSDGLKSLAYGNMTSILVKAIQELKAEVETLKIQINN